MEKCTLYRQVYLGDLGYVVYRHHEEGGGTVEQKARTHKVADFLTLAEAQDYCDYRNEHTVKNGSDGVEFIRREEGV